MSKKKILYGIAGEGMGHALRSKVILDHLVPNHDVTIVTSNRAYQMLSGLYPNVIDIHGLVISYKNNRLHNIDTLFENLLNMPLMTLKNAWVATRLLHFFPDLVISDYESFSYYYGTAKLAPVLAIDNIQAINRCELDVPSGFKLAHRIAKNINTMRTPLCKKYFITTFSFPNILPQYQHDTELFPPILRQEILDAESISGDHILVYQTSDSNHALIPTLNAINQQFIVYGMRRKLRDNLPDEKIGNCFIKNNNQDQFLEDLRTAKAVIANGGFTLISEAVHLQKPILSIPVQEHFEQAYNGLTIERMGYGKFEVETTQEVIENFINQIPNYAQNLQKYKRKDNNRILKRIDEFVAQGQ